MDHSHHNMNMSHGHNMDHNHNHANHGGAMPVAHGHGMGHDMMMHMTFHFGYSEKILFSFWSVSTYTGFISSLIGIFVISLIYEGIKYYREYLFWENLNSIHYKSVTDGQRRGSSLPDPEPASIQDVLHKQPAPKIWSLFNATQTSLHMLQMTISYLLMLIFMTFNVWLCAAVVLGSSTGYFFFGWKKTLVVDRNEHCH